VEDKAARRRGWLHRFTTVELVFIATMIVSVSTAVWTTKAAEIAIDGLKIGLVFFLITNLATTPERVRRLIWVLVLLGLWLGCGAIVTYLRTGSPAQGPNSGFLGDENDLALSLLVLLPMAGSLFQVCSGTGQRALAGITFIALIGGVICTFSRGGFVGLLFVLFGVGHHDALRPGFDTETEWVEGGWLPMLMGRSQVRILPRPQRARSSAAERHTPISTTYPLRWHD